jgi:2-methylcitrate dehydratase PrpD
MLAEPLETKRAPQTAIDAKFSLPYVTARAFAYGAIELEDFSANARADEIVQSLARRVTFETDPAIPSFVAGRMAIRLNNGAQWERSVTAPRGSPAAPMSWDDLVRKAARCARYARLPAPTESIERLAGVLVRIESESDAANAIFGALREP